MFWNMLHFRLPIGGAGTLLLMLLIALLFYFAGRLLRRKRKVKRGLTCFFVLGVFAMDVVYHFRIDNYLGYFSNIIFIPAAGGLLFSWVKLPLQKRESGE